MIEVVGREGNAVRFRLAGRISDEDYETVLIPAVNDILKEHEKVNALIEFSEEYEKYELGAMWEDTKFGMRHRNDFGRAAIVGAPRWIRWGANIGDKLMDAELKTFPPEQADKAWSWVSSYGA